MSMVLYVLTMLAGLFGFSGFAWAVTPYDSLVTAADITGLTTTQVTILVGVIGLVVISVAYSILANSLKKAKGGSR